MLYSETELKKRLKSGCPVFYFYASDEALVRSAAAKAEKFLSEEAPDTTTLDGPTPSVEDIVLAAGTISFFGGRRLVMLPLIRPSAYSDKDLQELCDTLSDTENAVFVLTSLLEEKYGKIKPGKREQKLPVPKPPCWTAAATTSSCCKMRSPSWQRSVAIPPSLPK